MSEPAVGTLPQTVDPTLDSVSPALSPEALILLAVSSELEDSVRLARLESLIPHADEEALFKASLKQRVFPLLQRDLAMLPLLDCPRLREALDHCNREAAIRQLALTREFLRVYQRFSSAGVPTLAYKGPALASMLFEPASLRHAVDIDLLVPEDRVLTARDLLLEDGYVAHPRMTFSPEEESEHLARHNEYNMEHREAGHQVEIHWHILDVPNRHMIESEWLWSETESVEVWGESIRSLAPERLFVVLCVHGGEKHRWARLKWVVDLARFVVVRDDVDWDLVWQTAVGLGRERVVLEGLHLAHELLHAPLPAAIADRVHRPDVCAFAAIGRGRMFREDGDFPGFGEWDEYIREHRCLTDMARWRRRLVYLKAILTPDWADRRRYPLRAGSPRQVLYRMRDLLARHRRGIFARLR